MIHFQHMKKGQILKLNEQGLSLRISRGRVWLTRSGDGKDYLLKQGETMSSDLNPLFLIEALEDTTVLYSAHSNEALPEVTQAGARVETADAGAFKAASAR